MQIHEVKQNTEKLSMLCMGAFAEVSVGVHKQRDAFIVQIDGEMFEMNTFEEVIEKLEELQ